MARNSTTLRHQRLCTRVLLTPMLHVDATSAECVVFTREEGLLSAVAHDLQIAVTRFQIDVDADARTVEARFEARSLRVQHALQDGAPSPDALTAEQSARSKGASSVTC